MTRREGRALPAREGTPPLLRRPPQAPSHTEEAAETADLGIGTPDHRPSPAPSPTSPRCTARRSSGRVSPGAGRSSPATALLASPHTGVQFRVRRRRGRELD
ncbi:hypothetical protein PVAP13_5NG328524 [Panicum virgatum]|uniref:Uncharacterized protein n=1 Tax=Panicum virgatum TaxID=38727 RepID=A0A8T0RRA0_PANVG|nr:hypothetical protein PVAP13_5NG328524 [Panicum virgatum]